MNLSQIIIKVSFSLQISFALVSSAQTNTKRMITLSPVFRAELMKRTSSSSIPVCTGLEAETGDPGMGISNAHKNPLTESRTFWLSWGKFYRKRQDEKGEMLDKMKNELCDIFEANVLDAFTTKQTRSMNSISQITKRRKLKLTSLTKPLSLSIEG